MPTVEFDGPEGVTLWLAEKQGQSGPYIALDKIQVRKDLRGQGLAAATMARLLAYADERELPIALTPDVVEGQRGLSKSALRRWYRSLGFVSNTGRSADLSISATMIRFPK